mgnify:FL=1
MGLFSFFSKKIVVAPGTACSSIAQALFNAKEGETITIKPGVYCENLEITKNVTLVGDTEKGGDLPIIQGGVMVKTPCRLEKIKIQKSPAHGIECSESAEVKMRLCVVCECGKYGVCLRGLSKITAEKCLFNNDGEGEVLAFDCSSVLLKKCFLQHPNIFVKSCNLQDSSRAEIKDCHLSDMVNGEDVTLSIADSVIDDGINSRDALKVKLKNVTVGGKNFQNTEEYLRHMHDEYDDVDDKRI